jgi:hypothetical protein
LGGSRGGFGKIGKGIAGFVALDEILEGGHDGGTSEELAEKIDFGAEFFVGDGLDEFFCGGASNGIEFADLRGCGASGAEGFSFGGELRDETNGLRAGGIDAAAREKKVANESVAEIALEARNSAETRDEAEAQFGKSKAGHFVGDDKVAGESEFESATEADTVNSSDGDEGSVVEKIQNSMNAFEKIADSREAFFFWESSGTVIELAKVGASGKAMFASTVNEANGNFRRVRLCGGDELLEFGEHRGADFVGGLAVECELDDGIARLPTEGFSRERLHDVFLSYMALISTA